MMESEGRRKTKRSRNTSQKDIRRHKHKRIMKKREHSRTRKCNERVTKMSESESDGPDASTRLIKLDGMSESDIERVFAPMKKYYPSAEEIRTNLKKDLFKFSKTVLQRYNTLKNADFEMVKLVGGYAQFECSLWRHVNFMAKSRDDPSPKLFFAEGRDREVTACCILDPDDPGVTIGCGFCDPEGTVCHPAGEFREGHYPYAIPALLPGCPFTTEECRRIINLGVA